MGLSGQVLAWPVPLRGVDAGMSAEGEEKRILISMAMECRTSPLRGSQAGVSRVTAEDAPNTVKVGAEILTVVYKTCMIFSLSHSLSLNSSLAAPPHAHCLATLVSLPFLKHPQILCTCCSLCLQHTYC